MTKLLEIEVDDAIAEALETRAQKRGQTMAELLTDLASDQSDEWPDWLEKMRENREGPWSPEEKAKTAEALAEYLRTGEGIPFEEVEAWVESLGTGHEIAMPKARKL